MHEQMMNRELNADLLELEGVCLCWSSLRRTPIYRSFSIG